MENIVNVLLDNFIYIVFAGIILILALIGYVVDASREEKIMKKLKSENEKTAIIPNIDPNIKISETIKGDNELLKENKDIPAVSPIKINEEKEKTVDAKPTANITNNSKNVK